MAKEALYDTETASLYASLGIEGTTYQPGFDAVREEARALNGQKALDFGCGAGRSTAFLKSLNPQELIGLDHNSAMLTEAKKRLLPDVDFIEVGTAAYGQKITPASFDAVFSFSVYCEFSESSAMRKMTQDIFDLLKPGGRFFVATTNPLCSGANFLNFHYDMPKRLEDGEAWPCNMHTDPPFTINDTYWTLDTIEAQFGEAGFTMEKRLFPLAIGECWLDETRTASQVVYHLVKQAEGL